jgi:hypothetical protein
MIPCRGEIFVFSVASSPVLESKQSPIQWVLNAVYLGSKAARGVQLPTHLHRLLKSRIVKVYLHSQICLQGILLS